MTVVSSPPPPAVYLSTVQYECITGYELVTGDLIRQCQLNEEFDGRKPLCRGTDWIVQ